MTKLSAAKVKSETAPGRYTDGGGLHLHIRANGLKAWIFRYMTAGKSHDMGLGSYPEVGLAEAREAAGSARKKRRAGVDPIRERREEANRLAAGRTFKDAAEHLIRTQTGGWAKNHAKQWTTHFTTYVYPVLGEVHVRDVTTEHVLRILQPMWNTKTETAKRLRGRIETVLDSAKVMHWRDGENPARWKGHLATILPKPSKVYEKEHFPSLPWQRVPAFLLALREKRGSGALAIELAILTGCRSGEVRAAPRKEFDLDAQVWTIPKDRMKSGKVHRVPLSSAAMALLARMHVNELKPDDLLFPGLGGKRMLNEMALTRTLGRMNAVGEGQPVPWVDGTTGEPITTHGFRSTFRVWAGETTEFPRELIEMALAHAVGNAVEAAYARTDLVERRRPLMEEWGQFVART